MTFGDMVSVIKNNLQYEYTDGCTSQQAFYKVRRALKEMSFKREVKPDLKLSVIFPKRSRKTTINEFVEHLGIDISMLKPHKYLVLTNLLILLLGIILLFVSTLIGIGLIRVSILGFKIMDKYSTELRVKDIRALCIMLTNERYSLSRSNMTVNRREVWNVVESYFEPYGLTEKLNPETKFEWAK